MNFEYPQYNRLIYFVKYFFNLSILFFSKKRSLKFKLLFLDYKSNTLEYPTDTPISRLSPSLSAPRALALKY